MRVLVLSDIHANLTALETVLAHAEKTKFLGETGFQQVWCLGDVVGYGPDPNECVARLRTLGDDLLCVAGNHDWAVLDKLPVDDFNPEARRAVLWTREQLTPASRAFLEELPDEPLVRGDFTITHASPRHPIWEYIIHPATARENFAFFDTPYCLIGHTHVPVIFLCRQETQSGESKNVCRALAPLYDKALGLAGEHRLILNPGSVGQPRDSDPRAAYAMLDTEQAIWHYRRVPYPYELTQARMRTANLPYRLIARLAYGW
ncbi:MAG: metallophosphoesterase family protein [Anaerolineae bacterium]|nr:metallophosphoesterase family protein [Anaerolineae bacterium]